jgi:tetratricopeptide (TPR) repeat protein
MEGLAPGGSIVVSEQTYKLTDGYFEFKPLGAARIKGDSEPVHIYEVLGVGSLRTRLQVATRRGLTHFVGRQHELEQMRRAFEQAKSGHGQIVGVMGEPGVGKSRLFHEFTLLSQKGCLVLETFSVSHGKVYPYLPLIDLLKNYLFPDHAARRRAPATGEGWRQGPHARPQSGRHAPLLPHAAGHRRTDSSLQQMDPQIRRQRTLEAIKRLLVRESLNQLLILNVEDLHWLDSETQAFLSLLSESVATANILLLVNYRPEYRHEWGQKTYYTQLRLDPLGQEDARQLLTALLGDDPALLPLKRLILEKTEGNPFFMEEIVQALVEQGVLSDPRRGGTAHQNVGAHSRAPLPSDLHIPTTVQAVLASRIDRLPAEEKVLLQTLAVIGKEFPLSLLKQVVNKPEAELHRLLSHLQAAEFIYEQPAFPEVEYTFKHALTQEVAYNSLLIERRKMLHERTAQAIESSFHSRLEDHYGDLAYHYSRSGNTRKAIEYLQLAGEQAVQRSANAEAINHFTAAVGLLKTLPDTAERAQQELTLQISLGAPLQATKGFAVPEVEEAYARARELCRQGGETPQLFSVLFGLWRFYLVRADLQAMRELEEQLFALTQNTQDPALLLGAHNALGVSLVELGEFAPARAHLEQSIALYDPRQHGSLAFVYGVDPGVQSLSRVARVLWALGYADQAQKRIHEALILARELSHPFSLAFALGVASLLHVDCREERTTREEAEALIALCTEQGFPYWLGLGTLCMIWPSKGNSTTIHIFLNGLPSSQSGGYAANIASIESSA